MHWLQWRKRLKNSIEETAIPCCIDESADKVRGKIARLCHAERTESLHARREI